MFQSAAGLKYLPEIATPETVPGTHSPGSRLGTVQVSAASACCTSSGEKVTAKRASLPGLMLPDRGSMLNGVYAPSVMRLDVGVSGL